MVRVPVECGDICAAADAQPFLNKVFKFGIGCTRVLTSDACGMRRYLRCSRCTAFFEQSIPVWNFLNKKIPVWNRLTYPTYVGIQYWQKIVLIRNQCILHTQSDEYFVWCSGGSGGGGGGQYVFFYLSSNELLSGQKQRKVRPTYKNRTPGGVWYKGTNQ